MQHKPRRPRHRLSPFVLIILILNGSLVLALAGVGLLKQASNGLERLAQRSTPTARPPKEELTSETAEEGVSYSDLIVPGPFIGYGTLARWNKDTVTFSFANCPRSLDCTAAHEAVRQAIKVWDAVTGLELVEVEKEGDITILWARADHGDSNPFDGPGNIVAHAALPYNGGEWWFDGDVHLDDDENWVISNPTQPFPRQVHLPTVALHELGHSLGLDHSTDPRSIMWAEYTGVRILSDDDIAGIQSLYGEPGAGEFLTSITGEGTEGVSATPTTTLRFRAGPGTEYAQIGRVLAGTNVPVIGRNANGNWLYVENQGVKGWIAGWYCNISGDLESVPTVNP